jgi:hypothetical protein
MLRYNSHWLRFNCHSKSSKQPGSGQRIIDVNKIPLNLLIDKAELDGNQIKIRWNSEAKQTESILPLQFLIESYPSNDFDLNEPPEPFKACKV